MNSAAKPTYVFEDVALADPEFKANPYAVYKRLRAEAPVCQVRFKQGDARRCWLITRYDDVISVLRNHQQIANDRRNIPTKKRTLRLRAVHALFGAVIDNMLGADEPDHTRLRGLVHKAFTQKRVEELRSQVEALTNELLTGLRGRQQWDVVNDFAIHIPTTVIAQMLGIPVSDRERFRRMFNGLLHSSATSWKGMAKNMPSFLAFLRYLGKLVKARRTDPQEDLISALIAAEESGDKLSESELVSMILLLLVAGYETTVNLIGNGTLALLEHPDQHDRLRRNSALVPMAVEEFLRYYSPLDYAQVRGTRTDLELHGIKIVAGEAVVGAIGSANRDETQFTNPDALDIAREPNRHIAFGQGIHYCLGAFLARMEGQIAFRSLIQHFPNLHLAESRQEVRWRESLLLRGVESLRVRAS